MRHWLGIVAALFLGALLVGAARAQVSEADAVAIRAVIQSQLDAFRQDDAAGAYSHASPTIQQKFIDAGNFLAMVRSGYPQVYRPREVEFRELGVVNGILIQDLFVVGPDGQAVIARYEMQRQPDGTWRINGCWLIQAPDESV